jgi:adenine-specific DNA-methyltransferase
MEQYRDKFQGLLRELFQFDCADLDFGIYRIMNYKRDVIEKFIAQDLPKAIAPTIGSPTLFFEHPPDGRPGLFWWLGDNRTCRH